MRVKTYKMANPIISFIRRKILRISKDRWDHQYNNGVWEGLKNQQELDRVLMAGKLLQQYSVKGNILEIGCGEGLFFANIPADTYGFYEGIDVSEVAVKKAPKTRTSIFADADMEEYTPKNGPFKVIVLNEVLYYSKNPLKMLARYTPYLDRDGLFMIGMYSSDKSEKLWPALAELYTEVDKLVITDDGKEWVYKMMKPVITPRS